MARTPLLRALVRRLTIARVAARRGQPADELLDLADARRGLTRRRFLRSTALAGAAVAVGCRPQARADRAAPRVAIVGAGIAGLHCAYRLGQAGIRASVFESSGRVGGRIFTDRTTFAPQHCELGGELIDTGHPTMHALARELDIPLFDYRTEDPSLARLTAHIGGARLTDRQILDGFAPIAAAIDAALATLRDPKDASVSHRRPNGGEALDRTSLAGWLDAIGARGPVRTLLEVAYTIEYGLEPGEMSCLNLFYLISTDARRFEVFGESDERFHAAGGNDAFVSRLAARLSGGQIEIGAALVRLARRGAGFALTFERGAARRDVAADHVVLALPFTRLREVDLADVELAPVKRRAIAEMGYGHNAKLMVGFAGRPWRAAGLSGEVFSDLGFQSTWETSRLQPGAAGILTNYTGGEVGLAMGRGTPAERAAEFVAAFDRVVPGARAAADGRVARFHWPSHAHTRGSYSAYRVGQYTAFAGVEGEPAEGGALHFCGEHTSSEAQGYMEGGAESGARAAREILRRLG